MSRIRSIHPGLWTDEAFMSLSAHGRLLLMGLWTEAYDDGVFEWKPLTLKAKLFPVDAVDVESLLYELQAVGCIARSDAHPKKPGLIRNFQKYQRPKKPNSSGMLLPEWLQFVGGSVSVPDQAGTDTEKSPQMEDGGGKREKETTPSGVVSAAPPENDLDQLQAQLLEAVGEGNIQPHGAIDLSAPLGLIAAGVDLHTDILPTIKAKAQRLKRPAGSWAYFTSAIQEAHSRRIEAGQGVTKPKTLDASEERWRSRLKMARDQCSWSTQEWGPRPGDPGCRVPVNLLEPSDGNNWKEWENAA